MLKNYEVTKTFMSGTFEGITLKVMLVNCHESPFIVGDVISGGTCRVDKVVELPEERGINTPAS